MHKSYDFWPKSWVNPLCKNANFSTFWKWLFDNLERLVLSLKHHLEVFQGVFSIKTDMHESSNFWRKSWVNPFSKNANFLDFLKMTFYSLERLLFSLKRYLEVFPGVFSIKTNMHEISNLWPKSWVNPFAKMQIFWLFENDLFIV